MLRQLPKREFDPTLATLNESGVLLDKFKSTKTRAVGFLRCRAFKVARIHESVTFCCG